MHISRYSHYTFSKSNLLIDPVDLIMHEAHIHNILLLLLILMSYICLYILAMCFHWDHASLTCNFVVFSNQSEINELQGGTDFSYSKSEEKFNLLFMPELLFSTLDIIGCNESKFVTDKHHPSMGKRNFCSFFGGLHLFHTHPLEQLDSFEKSLSLVDGFVALFHCLWYFPHMHMSWILP